MRRALRILVAVAAAGLAAVLLFGFGGFLHPAFDAFSHFRLHAAAALVAAGIAMVFTRARAARVAGAAAVALACAAIALTVIPNPLANPTPAIAAVGEMEAGQARYRLLQINLLYDNKTPEKVLSLIGRTMPDVITLDEVPERWQAKLGLIKAAYPYSIFCPPPAYIGGVAILSRRPFATDSKPRCFDRGSLAIADVDFGGRVVSVAALHLGWPWPFDQPDQIMAVKPALSRELQADALLAGDFNAVPWSATVRRIAAEGDMKIVRGIGPTWLDRRLPDALRRTVGLPIDNVLVKGRLLAAPPRRLGDVGSDHLPVLVEFWLKTEKEGRERMEASTRRPAVCSRQVDNRKTPPS